jgi:hypothetical protein
VHELADDDPVGALRGVERVPVGVHVPVGAHVGRRRAQPDPVVRALPAARHLGCHEPCTPGDMHDQASISTGVGPTRQVDREMHAYRSPAG